MMDMKKLTLKILPDCIGVCKLDSNSIIPDWAYKGEFFSITKTADELSIVCDEAGIPGSVACEKGWKIFKVQGVLDFSLVGIMASVTTILAKAGIGVFAIATYNTDYILVKDNDLNCAVSALRDGGHTIIE